MFSLKILENHLILVFEKKMFEFQASFLDLQNRLLFGAICQILKINKCL